MLQQFGPVTAVEMDNHARSRHPPKVQAPFCQAICLATCPQCPRTTSFACSITEHIPDDRAALNALHPVVKPGGLPVLTVPAYQWLFGPHDQR